MARSTLLETSSDLISDSGSVLWSFIKGEQLEFPVTLNFLDDVTQGYVFEAVVVEALNILNQTERPITIKPNGIQTTLVVRLPVKRGNWDPLQAYNKEEVVLYNGIYYKLLKGAGRIEATAPNLDPLWQVTSLKKIYIQYPASLGSQWEIAPAVGLPVYGFFELRVTEPTDSIFTRTWKPVRGMVEILFSPTDIVPDV